MIKDALAAVTRSAAFEGAVALAERLDGRTPGLLRVLTYHRVDRPEARPDLNPALISATPEAFASQMSWLARHYRVVALDEVVEAGRSGTPLPPRAVLVTFDDASVDFETEAWPVLSRLGLPATLFVPTAYPDHPERSFWWDRLYRCLGERGAPGEIATPIGRLVLGSAAAHARAYRALSQEVKRLPQDAAMALVEQVCRACVGQADAQAPGPAVLGWDALRRLAREGVSLAPHTRTHPLLHRIPADEAEREIAGSRADLVREIGAAPPVFAYPDGGYDVSTLDTLSRLGFELAFTTRRGINRRARMRGEGTQRLELHRINVGRRVTPAVFRARLLPWPSPRMRAAPAAGG
jgi:peptidoglycan/xylan/chitin deacetylase (PgdA/CDA1 family)